MKEQRILRKECIVGEYNFTVAVNRQMVLDTFKQCPELWKFLRSNSTMKAEDLDDIDTFVKVTDENEGIEGEIKRFVSIILPDMIALAESNVDAKEFLDYCAENEVDDQVEGALMEFALLGFTEGKGVKKPKVKVTFK